MKPRIKLYHLILAGMLLGILAGLVLTGLSERSRQFYLAFATTIGEVFIRLIWVVMVPLVLASLIVGVTSLGDPRKLGRIGLKTLTYFILTTTLAIAIGLFCVNVIKPGTRMPAERRQQLQAQYAKQVEGRIAAANEMAGRDPWEPYFDFVKSLVSKNIFASMVKDPPEMLPIIVFALLVGLCAVLLPETASRKFLEATTSFNEVMLKMVEVVMWTAPVGVFGLMVKVILGTGLHVLVPLAAYAATVLIGLALHFFIVYPLVVRLFSKVRPLDFLRAMREVFLTAFSTSSSAATLPVNLRTAQKRLNISTQVSSFVLPLGATVNMDGTALFQGVAAVFIAQVYGIDLTAGQQATILFTATLASIGAAPIPGAGLVMLAVIMTPLGIPAEGLALIFGVDRFLDMVRTVLNVTGDAAGAVMVAATEGEDVRYIPDTASPEAALTRAPSATP